MDSFWAVWGQSASAIIGEVWFWVLGIAWFASTITIGFLDWSGRLGERKVKLYYWLIPAVIFLIWMFVDFSFLMPEHIYKADQVQNQAMAKDLAQAQSDAKSAEAERDLAISQLNGKNPPQQFSFPNPDAQTVMTAQATVDIFVKSSENVSGYDLGSGGYMLLSNKGNVILLLMYAPEDQRNQQGNGRVRYTGVFNMDATSVFAKNTIGVIKQADYAQILEGGIATVIINSNVRFDIPIPPQTVTIDSPVLGVSTRIYARDIQPYLTGSKK
jgi:hypothetical protein